MLAFVVSLLCGIPWLVLVGGAAVQTNYSGFLVDEYCYGLSRAGGLALDRSNVITGPEEHILHCLRDVSYCRDGYFLAVNRGNAESKDYRIKFKLDAASHSNVLAFLDAYPKGHERDNLKGGFRVTAVGMHDGDGYLKDATFEECNGDGCDGICSVSIGNCDTPELDIALRTDALLICHVACMLLSWGCLLPLGVLWARNLRASTRKLQGAPIWFGGHRLIQSVGWLLQLVGFLCILARKKGAHFTAPHEQIGLIVVLIGSLQPLNAQLRHLKAVGHPGPDGARTALRRAWEVMHKGLGYVAVALGMINVCLGISHADRVGLSETLVYTALSIACIALGTLVIGGVLMEARRVYSYCNAPTVRQMNPHQVVVSSKEDEENVAAKD